MQGVWAVFYNNYLSSCIVLEARLLRVPLDSSISSPRRFSNHSSDVPHRRLILAGTSHRSADGVGVRDARVGLVLGAESRPREVVNVTMRSSRASIGVSVEDVLTILLDEIRVELATGAVGAKEGQRGTRSAEGRD